MSVTNYLAPLPQIHTPNRYNDPKTSQDHNKDFSKVLANEKNLSLRGASANSSLRGGLQTKQSSLLTSHEIATAAMLPRNDFITDKNGTNLAIKELAMDMEQQFQAYMWNLAFSSASSGSDIGSGEAVFQQELVDEIAKIANDGEMGEIAQNIYDEVVHMEGIKNATGIRNSGDDRK